MGVPYPGVDVRLDTDGEILVRDGNVFIGYFKDLELTAAILTEDGWLRSGDVGALDADGYLQIIGQNRDIIVTAGGARTSRCRVSRTRSGASRS